MKKYATMIHPDVAAAFDAYCQREGVKAYGVLAAHIKDIVAKEAQAHSESPVSSRAIAPSQVAQATPGASSELQPLQPVVGRIKLVIPYDASPDRVAQLQQEAAGLQEAITQQLTARCQSQQDQVPLNQDQQAIALQLQAQWNNTRQSCRNVPGKFHRQTGCYDSQQCRRFANGEES